MKIKTVIAILFLYSFQCFGQSYNDIKSLAERGDPKSQFELAEMYDYGDEVIMNKEQAFYWYRKSAEQGYMDAQYSLALMYEYGEGTTEDINQALVWYRKYANQGGKDVPTTIEDVEKLNNPSIKTTLNYIKNLIYTKFIDKNLAAYSCRSYKCITKDFEIEMNQYGDVTIVEKVYDTMFEKINHNTFKFNIKDVSIKLISNVCIRFSSSENKLKMISGNGCCERLFDKNPWHPILSLNVYDSDFSYEEQLKLFNAFKYLKEQSFRSSKEPEIDDDFFAQKNYINRHLLYGPDASSIPIVEKNGVRMIKVKIDNILYDGILDSGAATFLLTDNMVKKMIGKGYLSIENFVGTNTYNIANGQSVIGLDLVIPEVKIGDFTLKNVRATVIEGSNSSILIGQSVLNRFSKWEVDYNRKILILKK